MPHENTPVAVHGQRLGEEPGRRVVTAEIDQLAEVLTAVEDRHRARIQRLGEWDVELQALRDAVLKVFDDPEPPTLWQRLTGTPPADAIPAAARLATLQRARVRLDHLGERLALASHRLEADLERLIETTTRAEQTADKVTDAVLRADRQSDVDAILRLSIDDHRLGDVCARLAAAPVGLDHAATLISGLRRAVGAVATLGSELVDDLERALMGGASRDAQRLRNTVSTARVRVTRLVRVEEERGALVTDGIDQIADTFDPWTVPDAARLAAEQELAVHLRDRTVSEAVARARQAVQLRRDRDRRRG